MNNTWLYKLERRYGRYAIPNLVRYLIIGQLAVWVVVMLFYWPLLGWLTLDRTALLHGQLWRLVTFVFIPPITFRPLDLALDLYFLYFIGTALENSWGSFRFDLYYLAGCLSSVVSCLLLGTHSEWTMLYSLFFAFVCLFPDQTLLLFFILPIPVKWVGLAAVLAYLYQFFTASLLGKGAMLLGLANFFVFIGPSLWQRYQNKKRREAWKSQWR